MASATGSDLERGAHLRGRLEAGLGQIAFFVVPSVAGFVALGDVVTGALYQSGAFTREMTLYVWAILAAASLGLLPSTLGRLYSSAFYALHDTRTPLRIAFIRVSLGIALGYGLALHLPTALGLDSRWGAAGITLASGLAAGVEYGLLRRALGSRIGSTRSDWGLLARLWTAAIAGVVAGWLVRSAIPQFHPIPAAVLILGVFGATYLGGAALLGVAHARRLLRLG
jgi:putative peptidoglycan lipid II flippase